MPGEERVERAGTLFLVSLPSPWFVTSFYRFTRLSEAQVDEIRSALECWMKEHEVLGLVLVATEGVNGTVAGTSREGIAAFKAMIQGLVGLDDFPFKDSESDLPPFHRVSVDRRREIVGMKRPDLVPESTEDNHLSPREWHEWLESGRPALVVDTRNAYETQLGKFKGAIDPDLKTFSDWGAYLEKGELPTDVPVLIYCTGGIRCEKAILEMRGRGFEQVYQLRDGILGYLAEYPEGHYEGECFVFDDRVAVDKDLKPTERFGVCPACGLPASEKFECVRCGEEYYRCPTCEERWSSPVCSKACLDRYTRDEARRRAGKI